MIKPTFAAPQNFIKSVSPENESEALWFVFSKDQLLIHEEKKSLPDRCDLTLQNTLYMGTFESKHLFVGEMKGEELIPQGFFLKGLQALYGAMDEEEYSLAGQALQLIDWDRMHQYCGCCGHLTFHRKHERCRECSSCGHLAYPKLAPVVMVLIKRGQQILLARGPHFPGNMYSVLAGFVDPGETLEQCVVREVFEEVGLKVGNLRYFGSQPWPFSRSLLIGFICDWEEGEIHIDPAEIEDAKWFDYNDLPEIPSFLSLARILIESESFYVN